LIKNNKEHHSSKRIKAKDKTTIIRTIKASSIKEKTILQLQINLKVKRKTQVWALW